MDLKIDVAELDTTNDLLSDFAASPHLTAVEVH